ncbi:MAG TPA: AI-2E family transporter [Terriglobales bacterium]|jgi:predicted PurR-regulated permease PerM|nr:AI-2E family transporter [Terriglobales bacterium]
MDVRPHLRTTGSALKNWFIATLQDAAAVGAMWFIGLLILRVPLAFVWAIIGGACQFIPNFGPLIAVIGPALTTLFASESDAFMHLLYVFILYAIIAVIDGLVLQPYLMKRSNKVPIWASILAPIMLGIVIPFWGVLLAPPLLAVIYAYRGKRVSQSSPR